MSTSYSIFIKVDKSVLEVKSSLEKVLNVSLERSPSQDWEIYYGQLLGIGVGLVGSVDYEDDVIRFSEYAFQILIDYKGGFDREYSDEFRSIASIVIANMISIELSCECIAVENVHSIIQRFAPREGT